MKSFVKVILIVVVLLLSVNVLTVTAEELPPVTKVLVKFLSHVGYSYWQEEDGLYYFRNGTVVLAARLTLRGAVNWGIVVFGGAANYDTAVAGIYGLYSAFQLNKGKTQILDENLGVSKMRNLMDAAANALRHTTRFSFRYDDMRVTVARDDEKQLVTVVLEPYW